MRSVSWSVGPSAGRVDQQAVLAALLRVCADLGLRFAVPYGAVRDLDGGDVVGELLDRLGGLVPLRTVDYATFWAVVAVHAAEDDDAALVLPMLPHPQMEPPRRLADLCGAVRRGESRGAEPPVANGRPRGLMGEGAATSTVIPVEIPAEPSTKGHTSR